MGGGPRRRFIAPLGYRDFFLPRMGSIFQEAAMGLDDYVELPDLSLSALQKRFTLPSELEELYQRYEQRFQVGKLLFWCRGCIVLHFQAKLNYDRIFFRTTARTVLKLCQ